MREIWLSAETELNGACDEIDLRANAFAIAEKQ